MESSQSAGPRCIHPQESFVDGKGATEFLGVVVCGMSASRSRSVVFRLRERKDGGSVGSECGYKFGPTVVICLFRRLSLPLF